MLWSSSYYIIHTELQVFPFCCSCHPRRWKEIHSQPTRSQILLTFWKSRSTFCVTRKHPIIIFLLWHMSTMHSPHRSELGCLSHLSGTRCGLCNRAEWVRAGLSPSVTVAPGCAIFSSFASSSVSLVACQSDERYFLWASALFSFVNSHQPRPLLHNAVPWSPGDWPTSKQAFFYNWTFSNKSTLLCIMLTVCWLRHFLGGPDLLFFQLCGSSCSVKMWEAHITRKSSVFILFHFPLYNWSRLYSFVSKCILTL